MGQTPATLDSIYTVVQATQEDVDEIKEQLKILNGTVRQNCTDIAILKDWRATQADPATRQIPDMKAELAKVGVQVGGIGAVTTIAILVLRALGVF